MSPEDGKLLQRWNYYFTMTYGDPTEAEFDKEWEKIKNGEEPPISNKNKEKDVIRYFLDHYKEHPLEKELNKYGDDISKAIGLINNAYCEHEDPRSYSVLRALIQLREFLAQYK